ncbi:MAG: sel1 repeat family protein [Rhodocyclales bacterium]|nr:sel1 repeat family protein [Rhodocyclales bacterium]
MNTGLAPLAPAALLGIFRNELETPLVVRGAAQGVEMLGGVEFWASLSIPDLKRMALGGNGKAQAELAWRHAGGGHEGRPAEALRWALKSAESDCVAGIAVLGWLLHKGLGLPRDDAEAARLFAIAAARGSTLASFALGRMRYFGIGIARDFAAAVPLLQRARADHPEAKDLLARCHFHGRGLPEDRDAALKLWRDAAKAGVGAASYCLGMCLHVAAKGPPHAVEAVGHLRAAADSGIAAAMFLLGQCAMFGTGMARDPGAALEWYRRAAAGGSRDAEFELGECLALGVGSTLRDATAAVEHWQKAARVGHVRALLKVAHAHRNGDGVVENRSEALRCYRLAAERGEVQAWVWLGEVLEQGDGGLPNPAAARRAYARAAQAGDAHGQAEHGRCLLHGIGGASDIENGVAELEQASQAGWEQARGELERFWFERGMSLLEAARTADDPGLAQALACLRRAATSGHRRAAFMLAECLSHGTGAPVDLPQALGWYRQSATLVDAQLILGDMLYFGRGVPRNAAEAFTWYLRAAIQHQDAYAMYSCGFCLLHGDGTDRDTTSALRWLKRAAAQGEANACHELGNYYLRSGTESTAPRQALRWLRAAAGLGHAAATELLGTLARRSPAG